MGNYEFDGEKYKLASKHQKEWGSSLISSLDIRGNESILDLGCGDGLLTEQLSKLVPQGNVLGIDASKNMIQSATELKNINLSFVCLDINQIDFDEQFDVIFSNAALHWVKNHEMLLRNCIKALKPSGYIAWNFAGHGTCTNFNPTVKDVTAIPKYKKYFINFEWPWYMPKLEDYINLISKSGFRKYEVREENKDRFFKNSDELIRWTDQPSLVPFICRIPDEEKERFRNIVVERMLNKTLLSDGRCFETFSRINIIAQK